MVIRWSFDGHSIVKQLNDNRMTREAPMTLACSISFLQIEMIFRPLLLSLQAEYFKNG